MPAIAHLSPETLPIKAQTCRFCMHQYQKSIEAQSTSTLSQYCPMDLYSSDLSRVKKAIDDLWDNWMASGGSANNLRIFLYGDMIKPDVRNPLYSEVR